MPIALIGTSAIRARRKQRGKFIEIFSMAIASVVSRLAYAG
jgi:hypothetical protein